MTKQDDIGGKLRLSRGMHRNEMCCGKEECLVVGIKLRKNAGVALFFFFSSRRRHTRLQGDWSSDVCSSDLLHALDSVRNVAWPRSTAGLPNRTPRSTPTSSLPTPRTRCSCPTSKARSCRPTDRKSVV